jgi:hypothetical protein
MRAEKKQGAGKEPAIAPRQRSWREHLFLATLWVGAAAGAYFCGRYATLSRATAEPSTARPADQAPVPVPESPGRPVAQIYKTEMITWADLGDYLINRGGKERVKNLINKRIIEHAARQRGIVITEAEVDAALSAYAKDVGLQMKDLVAAILKRYGKSIYEWREDVIKPRLMLEKMCRAHVSVTREDIALAWEALYGEKVDCKMIMWPKDEYNAVLNKIWPEIRESEKEFDHYARLQASPSLAAVGGHIKPIGRNTTGNKHVEDVLFNLRPGEVSEVLDTPEGVVVFKCLGRVPTDKTVSFERERANLEKQVFDKKIAMEVGKMFQELSAEAQPVNFLEPTNYVKQAAEDIVNAGKNVQSGMPGNAVPVSSPRVPAAVSHSAGSH